MLKRCVGIIAGAVAATLAGSPATAADAPRSPTPRPEQGPFQVTTFAEGLENGWAVEVLPDGRLLVTERPGRMRIIAKDGKLSAPLGGLPRITAERQGGLLDVALSPGFANDQLIYFSYAEAGDGGLGTAVARARLTDSKLENAEVVWRQTPKVQGGSHFGSRILFRPDGTIFITVGERNQKTPAQDLSTTMGKVIRINADGTAPRDNPFAGKQGARPEIWSYGHRNIQAAALHPQTHELWTVEHGARGGDELNRPQPGRNYGWPVITYGIDYSGAKIGEGTAKAGMEQPIYYWDPVIAPSGALFYTGKAFAEFQGDLFIGSLQPGGLVRLDIEDGRVARETRYDFKERIRDVQQDAEGSLYLITDSPRSRVIKLARPAS